MQRKRMILFLLLTLFLAGCAPKGAFPELERAECVYFFRTSGCARRVRPTGRQEPWNFSTAQRAGAAAPAGHRGCRSCFWRPLTAQRRAQYHNRNTAPPFQAALL